MNIYIENLKHNSVESKIFLDLFNKNQKEDLNFYDN